MKKLALILCLILLPVFALGQDVVVAKKKAAGGSGTFGKETIGASSGTCEAAILCGRFQNLTGGTGTTASISLYLTADTAATAAKVAIYDDSTSSPNNLLGSSAEFNPSAYATNWYDFALSIGANTIANNGYFWLCMWANAGGIVYAREATGGVHSYEPLAYDGNWPTPLSEDATGANEYSIHCDITW